jgi:hypothetical protein
MGFIRSDGHFWTRRRHRGSVEPIEHDQSIESAEHRRHRMPTAGSSGGRPDRNNREYVEQVVNVNDHSRKYEQ